jgi:ureidoacrylate peracid hydrolase
MRLYRVVGLCSLLTFCLVVSTSWAEAPKAFTAPSKVVTVQAKPEPIKIDVSRTAIIVVDMQNAFLTKGGMFDLFGWDISGARAVIDNHKKLLDAARKAGAKVIYLLMSYEPDYSDSGGPESPNWHKEVGLVMMQKNPNYWGKFVTKGGWDEAVTDELKPQAGDIVVRKHRYSGFMGTNLDDILKSYTIKYAVYTGVATNVCVESTLRDGYFLGYWPIIVSDAVNNAGPPATQQATLWNVENLFGWVTSTADIVKALSGQ